jgi:hypothetical protein
MRTEREREHDETGSLAGLIGSRDAVVRGRLVRRGVQVRAAGSGLSPACLRHLSPGLDPARPHGRRHRVVRRRFDLGGVRLGLLGLGGFRRLGLLGAVAGGRTLRLGGGDRGELVLAQTPLPDPRLLPAQLAQVVELGPADTAPRHDVELADRGRVQGERPLDSDTE